MQDIEALIEQMGLWPFFTLVLLVVVFVVSGIVTWWKLYTKAGEAGWKYLVPVYGSVIMARIAKVPERYGWLAGGLSLVSSVENPVASILLLAYIVVFIYIVRELIARYDAPLSFWLYAILLPIVAVFRVDSVSYKKAEQGRGPVTKKA